MPDMSKLQVKMPEQPADLRAKNFDEVALGYDEEMAVSEASRCLNCKTSPCAKGCPVHIDISLFINKLANRDFDAAFGVIREANALPAICGRVCPQENQCEKLCVRGKTGEPVAIGNLERFLADRALIGQALRVTTAVHARVTEGALNVSHPEARGDDKRRVAVVGSGPASLTCAGALAKYGFGVTIFESLHTAGGVLSYGIPEFRLPKEVVRKEIDLLLAEGVDIVYDTVVGKTIDIYDLFSDGYGAVFLGTGAGLPSFMNIPGENLCGVYSANEFLTRVNLMRAYLFPETDTPVRRGKRVAVFGGGNVALDAARCARRLGAEEVYIVYRRSEDEMPARAEEIRHARDEGIIFQILTNPTRILGDENGWVRGIECLRMELGTPDESGRKSPVPVKGSEFILEADTVIVAIGQSPNPMVIKSTPELKISPWGGIKADAETGATSMQGVFAGGDNVSGAATVILAMGAGKAAAESIGQYLRGFSAKL